MHRHQIEHVFLTGTCLYLCIQVMNNSFNMRYIQIFKTKVKASMGGLPVNLAQCNSLSNDKYIYKRHHNV